MAAAGGSGGCVSSRPQGAPITLEVLGWSRSSLTITASVAIAAAVLLGSGALVATMNESNVNAFLSSGNTLLIPPPVLTNISMGTMSPMEYMTMVDQVYLR